MDARGLGEIDRRILETILRHGGSPVGAKTIAVTVGEKETTIEDVYEPYLIQLGYIERTPRGRVPTEKAISEYGKEHPGDDRRCHEDEARRAAEEQRKRLEKDHHREASRHQLRIKVLRLSSRTERQGHSGRRETKVL